MPGTKASGRPGGNPDIAKYGFKVTEDREPFNQKLQVRITPTMKKQLDEMDNPSDFIRSAISEHLKRQKKKQQQLSYSE